MTTYDRTHAIKALKRDYPDIPTDWLSMAFDFVINHPELAEKVNSGEIVPKAKVRDTNMGSCVEYKSEQEMNRLEKVGRIIKVVSGDGN